MVGRFYSDIRMSLVMCYRPRGAWISSGISSDLQTTVISSLEGNDSIEDWTPWHYTLIRCLPSPKSILFRFLSGISSNMELTTLWCDVITSRPCRHQQFLPHFSFPSCILSHGEGIALLIRGLLLNWGTWHPYDSHQYVCPVLISHSHIALSPGLRSVPFTVKLMVPCAFQTWCS